MTRPAYVRTLTVLSLGASATLLIGCASRGHPAPAIGLDAPPEPMTRAELAPAPGQPVKVVAVPEPLPLPGQLKPVGAERGLARPEPVDPTARVNQAVAAARIQPARDGFVNAVQLWPWTPGALYQVYASPGRVTDIALQAGEALISVSAGDTTRWIIGDTTSGAGASAQVHVLVKPSTGGLKTNLLIYTDRRTYQLELTAHPSTWMASVAWRYPQDDLLALRAASAQAAAGQPIADGIAVERLRFRYRIGGDHPSWRPVQAFDDGAKVYIQFPAGVAQGEMPPLFVIGTRGEAQLVNYRASGTYYVVDSLFGAAELRLGDRPQQVVRIERTDGRGGTRSWR